MEYSDIKKIIELMKENELTAFELQEEDFRIAIKRGNGDSQIVLSSPPPAPVMVPAPAADGSAGSASAASGVEGSEKKMEAEPLPEIISPIVGTFYRSPSPEADPFVSVGQSVNDNTVVCIVEAMKVMNEIKAETCGIIREILVENGNPVEYGQPLFKVEPL